MSNPSYFDAFKLPLSGDVTMPWSWMRNSMGQFGYININQKVSSNPALERDIVEGVAGYGKQLGRIMDVIDILVTRLPAEVKKEHKPALDDYREMARDIAVVKAGHLAPTQESLDRLIAGIRFLKEHDEAAYRTIVDKLRAELPGDGAQRKSARSR
jgi:hypothetical protein